MRCLRLIVVLVLALLLPQGRMQAQTVHSSVTSFFESLQTQPLDTIESKVFALIDASAEQGAEVQSTLAGMAFDFFTKNPVMGVEKVAVDVAKKYFLSEALPWKGTSSLPALKYYVEFNESSQIGCDAPELWMESLTGEWVSLRGLTSGRTVLFFYSAQCATCQKKSDELTRFAASYDGDPLTIVTVFTESDREAWTSYVRNHFKAADNSKITFIHLWDPEAQTSYHKKYAVMSTPQLFLLDQQNKIIGRRLNVAALEQILLNEVEQDRQYDELFDKVFDSLKPLTEGDAAQVVDALASKSELPDGTVDSTLFRESMLALFQYLRYSDETELQNGAVYLAENHIIARPAFWSEEFVSNVAHQLMLYKRNPVDSKATDLVLQDRKGRVRNLLQTNQNRFHLVVFHLLGCQDCQKVIDELAANRTLLYNFDTDVTLVYVGENEKEWKSFIRSHPSSWRYLHDPDASSRMRILYDLEYVPHLYLMDENNIIVAKDIKTDTLFVLLNHFNHY